MTEEQVLNNCGCCEGITKLTPQDLANPPGLSALAYRIGTYGSFKTTMLADLAGPGGIPVLTTRADDDPAIALLDATAVLLDVLAYYQERIANEGYLRTATERMSVLELARTIGYELKPGVAASTYLAFEMETAPTAPTSAIIPVGTKVQSLPGQDEKPQTFETVEPIVARPVWNRLWPRSIQPHPPKRSDTELYLQGLSTNLRPGDVMLVLDDEHWRNRDRKYWGMRRVVSFRPVTPNSGAPYTVVSLDRPLDFIKDTNQNFSVFVLRQRASLFGHNAPAWRSMSNSVKAAYLGLNETDDRNEIRDYPEWPGFTVAAVAETPAAPSSGTGLYGQYYADANLDLMNLKHEGLDDAIDFRWNRDTPGPWTQKDIFWVRWTGTVEPKIYGKHKFSTSARKGVRLWVDGRLLIDNWEGGPFVVVPSPDITLCPGRIYDVKLEYRHDPDDADFSLLWLPPRGTEEIIPTSQLYPRSHNTVHLDAAYPQLLPASWLVLATEDAQEVYQIVATAEMSRAAFLLSAKTTRLTLSGGNLREKFNDRLRETSVFAASEALDLAGKPDLTPVEGDRIVLDQRLPDLQAQRTVIVSGKRQRVAVQQAKSIPTADGGSKVEFVVNDSLLLARTPEPQTGGQEVWTLIDKNGVTRSVRFTSRAEADAMLPYVSSAPDDVVVSEVAIIKEVTPGSDPTEIVLARPLLCSYDRSTVVIYGNVAAATHGETRREVLGSGDAARGFQKFILKQKPLTYVSATTASGAASTLKVRVNDVLWQGKPSLYDLPVRERAYITRLNDDGNVAITFGDGVSGARLPTGDENIVAIYRTGIGAAGMVKAGQLSLLMTRPLGVQKVTNPLAPTGAADPETRDQARQNAPFTVLTLDRIVSLRDFEDFARAYAGIGKAQATWLWNGEQRIVHVTIAAATSNGADYKVDLESELFKNLRLAMDAVRDTVQRLVIASYEPVFFLLKACVVIDPTYIVEKVLAAVKAALQQTYDFERRDFGQPVYKSEVLATIQAVEGVIAVFLDQLFFRGETPGPSTPPPLLPASRAARAETATGPGDAIKPAQLLLLDPNGIDVTEVKP